MLAVRTYLYGSEGLLKDAKTKSVADNVEIVEFFTMKIDLIVCRACP